MRRAIQGPVAAAAALVLGLLTACGQGDVGASSHPQLVRTDDPTASPTADPSPGDMPRRERPHPNGVEPDGWGHGRCIDCDICPGAGCDGQGHCIDWCGTCDAVGCDGGRYRATEIVEPDEVRLSLFAPRSAGREPELRLEATAVLTNGCQSAGVLQLATSHGDGPDVEPNLWISVVGYERHEWRGSGVGCTADVRYQTVSATLPMGDARPRSWQLDLTAELRDVDNVFSVEQEGYGFALRALDARNTHLASGGDVQELVAYPLDVARVFLGSGHEPAVVPTQGDTEPARSGETCASADGGDDRFLELRAHADERGWSDTADEYGIEGARGPSAVLAVVRDRDVPFDASAAHDGALVVGHLADGAPVCLVGLP